MKELLGINPRKRLTLTDGKSKREDIVITVTSYFTMDCNTRRLERRSIGIRNVIDNQKKTKYQLKDG